MRETRPRRLLGLGAVIAVGLMTEFLPDGPPMTQLVLGEQYVFLPRIREVFLSFVIFSLGAYISRCRFLPVAVGVVILVHAWIMYILYQIALPVGNPELVRILVANLPGLITPLLAATLGTFVGEHLYSRHLKTG